MGKGSGFPNAPALPWSTSLPHLVVSLPWNSSAQQELASELEAAELEGKLWTDNCQQPWPGRAPASPGSSVGL